MSPFPIIDAHHHIWRRADQPWLNGPMVPRIFGPYEPIRRDYPIAEYLADCQPAGVVASVYVQTNWAPERAAAESAWVQGTADRHGFPQAIVAYADLADPGLEALLDQHAVHANLRGIRQQLHWHVNEQYRFASRPDVMDDPAWRRGLAALGRRGLLFELQVFASQMPAAARLAGEFPTVSFVLMHCGMPEDLSPDGRAAWRQGMAALAAQPNVAVKLSGLGTFVHRLDTALIADILAETIGRFGAGRCLFGSNFPIEKLWTSYGALVEAYRTATASLGEAGQRAIFHDTAARLYRVG